MTEYALVLGMRQNEIKEPFHPSIDLSRLRRLPLVIGEKEVIECGSNIDAKRILDQPLIRDLEEITIVGAWAQYCIAGAILEALGRGITTYSPEEALFYKTDSTPDLKDLKPSVDFWNDEEIKYQYAFTNEVHIFTPQRDC